MTTNRQLLFTVLSALFFTLLFYKQAIGLNLLIFETIVFLGLCFSNQYKFSGKIQLLFGLLFIFSSLITVLTHTAFSFVMNIIAFIVFIGILIYPEAKSIVSSIGISVAALFTSQAGFINKLTSSRVFGKSVKGFLWKFRILFIPLLIIFIFIILYSSSNPVFGDIFSKLGKFLQENLSSFFSNINFQIVFVFVLGLIISNYIIFRNGIEKIIRIDKNANDNLIRKRKAKINQGTPKVTALKSEYKAGLFLVVVLNILLLILNILDIDLVWFNFEWSGQYLKQFVHEGTYLLIISIIISILIVQYFFRGNINFYKNNSILKYLSYFWLIQNGILVISVAIRNYRYIEYFALAYKRIGVFIFLILVLIGLLTVFIKVYKRKSIFYLLRINVLAIILVLIVSSAFNWDIIIAKYNFRNSDKSFLHLDYLVSMPDKCLPILDKSLEELQKIETIQKERFPFKGEYMSADEYYNIIQNRKTQFRKKRESVSFLSWNLPDFLAYKNLKD